MVRSIDNDGVKLTLFRKVFHKTQAEVARVLWPDEKDPKDKTKPAASSVRKVSYIESGTRSLSADEMARLLEAFPDFAQFRPADILTVDQLLRIFEPLDFLDRQQDFLKTHAGEYDLWMFNGALQPVLDNTVYQKSWRTNLEAGSRYTVLWDLTFSDDEDRSFITFSPFKSFLTAMVEVLKDVDLEKIPEDGKLITLFPYIRQCSIWTDGSNKVLQGFVSSISTDERCSGKIDIRKPFSCWCDTGSVHPEIVAPSLQALWMLIKCHQAAASTVVYLPKDPYSLPEAFAASEPPAVLTGFDDMSPGESRHLLLDRTCAESMATTIRIFQDWADTNLPSMAPSTLNSEHRKGRSQ